MEHRIDKWSGKIDASAIGAALAVAGKLQIYVCHDGTLEVYLDGKDIKEALGIDASSTWFDFGEAVLSVETYPGEETEMRPKDFGKQEEVIEEKGDIGDLYFDVPTYRDMITQVFGVPATELEEKPKVKVVLSPRHPIFLADGEEFELPF